MNSGDADSRAQRQEDRPPIVERNKTVNASCHGVIAAAIRAMAATAANTAQIRQDGARA